MSYELQHVLAPFAGDEQETVAGMIQRAAQLPRVSVITALLRLGDRFTSASSRPRASRRGAGRARARRRAQPEQQQREPARLVGLPQRLSGQQP